MADDLSLLLKIRGDASGAQKAAADTRTAIAKLRTQVASDSKATGTSLETLRGSVALLEGPLGGVAGRLGSLSGLMSGMASPAGIAVAAMTALAIGVASLTKEFFDLAISTAQWEGKLYDLSQQTGVSVETLSALSAMAEDTGGSIESIAQSLVLFQGHLEDAQDSASKTGQKFAELGISTNNTEEAFRDALRALAAMPETFHQTNEAAELFGRRGGKQILAILKESHGDIDATIEKLQGLNSLVTTDVARTADGLNDQLNATQRQFRGLQAQIVNESMPLIIKALQDLSKILRDNREVFILLGQAIGLFLQGNLRILAPALDIASRAVDGHKRALLPLIEIYGRLAAVMQIVTGSIPNVDPNAIPAVALPSPFNPGATSGAVSQILGVGTRRAGTSRGGGGGVAQISAGQQLLNQLTEEYNRLQEKANELSKIKIVALEILDSKYKDLSPTLRDQIFQQAALIDQSKKQADLDKRKEQATEKIREFLNRQNEAIRDVRMGNDDLSDSVQALEAELKKLGLTMDEDTKRALDNAVATRRASQAVRERIALEQTRIDMATRERIATPERKQEQLEIEQEGPFGDIAGTAAGGAAEGAEAATAWEQALGSIMGRMEEFHTASQTYVVGAFHGMADAATDAIQAWILYGGSLGKALKQALAAELAHIAAKAAIQSVLHAAYALGSLAFGDFAGAARHGIAAAKFAAVAALTGIAARGLASGSGGSFQQAATNSGAVSRGGDSSSGSSRLGQPSVTDVNRRAIAEPQILTRTLEFRVRGDAVVQSFVEDYNFNGRTRVIIKSDGQG